MDSPSRPSRLGRPRAPWWPWLAAGVACAAVAALTLTLTASPSYDAWAWLGWGDQLSHLRLDTINGPAWKPLPVLVTTVLAATGDAAPDGWLLVARAGGLAGLVLAFVVARRAAGGGVGGALAGALAVVGVASLDQFFRSMAQGTSEPLLVATILGAVQRAQAGRPRQALVVGALAGLIRPESWPVLALGGGWLIKRDRRDAPFVLGLGAAVAAAWIVPEWIGSGQPLRALSRSTEVDTTSYAGGVEPVDQVLRDARDAIVVPLLAGIAIALAVALRRPRRWDVLLATGVGAAWVGLVVSSVARGLAGSPRYLMGGTALLAVVGAVGWGLAAGALVRRGWRIPGALVGLVAVALAAVALPDRVDQAQDAARRTVRQSEAEADLPAAVAAAGGRARVVRCGDPATGRFKSPVLAWLLHRPIDRVISLRAPEGFTFQLRQLDGTYAPEVTRRAPVVGEAGRWRVVVPRCRALGWDSAERRPLPAALAQPR
jgi:hypothetical protein